MRVVKCGKNTHGLFVQSDLYSWRETTKRDPLNRQKRPIYLKPRSTRIWGPSCVERRRTNSVYKETYIHEKRHTFMKETTNRDSPRNHQKKPTWSPKETNVLETSNCSYLRAVMCGKNTHEFFGIVRDLHSIHTRESVRGRKGGRGRGREGERERGRERGGG